jgi:ABC-2 type transport system permease protein
VNSFNDALIDIEKGNSDLILEIPNGFERNVIREGSEKVYVAANAVNGTKGGLGSSYLINILNDFNLEIFPEKGLMVKFGAEIKPLFKYNNRMDYKVFMVPALLVMILTLICGFLPAVSIVLEKEIGTMEQMNVSPIPKTIFILAKLIPFWIIGFIVINIGFLVAWAVYGLVPAGHFYTIYFFAIIYIFTVSGLGLIISNFAQSLQ